MTRKHFWLGGAALALLLGFLFSLQPTQALTREGLQRGLRASVKLLTVDADETITGTCSGTVLNPEGYILTNFHCVGQTDLYGEDPSLAHGDLNHPDGLLGVAINEDPRDLPVLTYIAHFVAGDPDQDVAVVKIVGYADGSGIGEMPDTLPLVPNILMDSDVVEIGDEVNVIGFPGVGGDTVTFTEGKISGFTDLDGDGNQRDWFKTSALINGGNSGGTAVNENGEQVGIPSAKISGDDTLYFIKPINYAMPSIERALQLGEGGTSVEGGPNTGGATPNVPAGEQIGTLTFGTGFTDSGLAGAATAFPSGTSEIHAAVPYQGMRNGVAWEYVWQLDGQDAVKEDGNWNDGPSGMLDLSVFSEEGLPDGTYNLQIFVAGRLVREGGFTIGNPNAPTAPQAPAPPSEEEGVLLLGQIVDLDTGRPIEGAGIFFLNPGATIADVQAAEDWTTLIHSAGVSDADGYYVLTPPLLRGNVYSVVIAAEGYQPLLLDDALEITADDPAMVEVDAIGLERR